jgi:hypothetical protein
MGLALVTLMGWGALAASGCTSYIVKSRAYSADVDYAKPQPGKFRVVKRNLTVTTFWDSETSKAEEGSEAYLKEMTSLMVRAMAQLVAKAQLGPNQALYNVRISAPGVADRYFAYFIIGAAIWYESRYTVTLSADVIEFI